MIELAMAQSLDMQQYDDTIIIDDDDDGDGKMPVRTSNGMIVTDSSPDDPVTCRSSSVSPTLRYTKSGKVYKAPSLKTPQG